jgi:hypothetical protein
MKSVVTHALRLLTCLVLLSTAALADSKEAPDPRLPEIQGLAWGVPEGLLSARAVHAQTDWSDLDWTSDGCSTPFGLETTYRPLFTPACELHDFAYSALGRLDPSEDNRLRSDDAFYRNLHRICELQDPDPIGTRRLNCLAEAWIYFRAVRLWGGGYFAAHHA